MAAAQTPDVAEVSGGEELAPGAGEASAGAATAGRRRQRHQEVQEVVDELAHETKRTALLDRVEQQVKGQTHVSRLLFGFSLADDKKIQSAVEQEFNAWRDRQDKQAEGLSGILLFASQAAIQLLEGPAELLFQALQFFSSLSAEAPAAAAAAPTAQPALISPVRILHFTELHSVRVSTAWCACSHPGKLQGGNQLQLEDGNSHELTFAAYQKLLILCLKVQEISETEEVDQEQLQGHYRRLPELMPTVDEVMVLQGKNGAEHFFTYPEFEKVFMEPFHLVLRSELLWPMPPVLSY